MRLGNLIGVTGLMLDIIGAWYLSRGLVRKNLKEIVREAPQASFGINVAYVIGALTQRIEARTGFGFLFFGFVLQALSYLLKMELSSLNLRWWITLSISVPVVVFIVSDLLVKTRARTVRKKYLREEIIKHMEATDKPKHIEDTKRYLKYLGIKFDENISMEDAWSKLMTELGL